MKNKGISWVLTVVALVVVTLIIVAFVFFNRMREAAANFDILSAAGNYLVFCIVGVVIVVILIWLFMRRG